jgi:hypothetical protein
MRGATVGNGVLGVGEGVAVAVGFGVATCPSALAKNVTKPTRTHALTKAIPDRIRAHAVVCWSSIDLFFIAEISTKWFV